MGGEEVIIIIINAMPVKVPVSKIPADMLAQLKQIAQANMGSQAE